MKEKYGFADNLKYVVRGMKKDDGHLLELQILGVISETVSLFIIPVTVKLIIDSLAAEAGYESPGSGRGKRDL